MQRCAMHLKSWPQRISSRTLFILVAVILCLFVLFTIRLRTGSSPSFLGILLPSSISSHLSSLSSILPGIHGSQKTENANSGGPHRSDLIHRPTLASGVCTPEVSWLRRPELGLTDNIHYSRRCFKVVKDDGVERSAVARVPQSLFNFSTVVNLTSCYQRDPVPCKPVSIHTHKAYPRNDFSQYIFGVASSYDRLNSSALAFAHWLSDTQARLVAVVVDALKDPPVNLTALELEYARRGIRATIKSPPSELRTATVEAHHFMLVKDLLEAANSKTRWLGIVDDDTFIPSLYPLNLEMKKLDHKKPVWLGALSDDFTAVNAFGYMAFGGAGVFVSVPLAKDLEPHLDGCREKATIHTGDGMLRDCIYHHTHTKLTLMNGLYQHDIHGDASGFFESGVCPLSVHHWKSWYKEPMPEMAAVGDLCGDCFLQRWQFEDNVLFANGYSVTQYANGLEDIDLDKMEGTWDHPNQQYDFSYAPLRRRLNKAEKKSFKLLDIRREGTNSLHQLYVHRGDDSLAQWDEVIEISWEV